MRKLDKNSAENFIRKHERYKKWVIFALCLSLLSGSLTFYMLNKPATAMTEEGAQSIGLVLDTADSNFEAELIAQTEENNSEDQSDIQEEGSQDDEQTQDQDGNEGSDDQNSDDQNDEDQDVEDSEDAEEEEEDAADEASTLDTEEDASDEASTESTEKSKKKERPSREATEKLEDVVITVLFQDEEGTDIDESKELSISESFNLAEEAREIEGYIFFKGYIDDEAVTLITKKTETLTYTEGNTADDEASDEEDEDSAASGLDEEDAGP